MNNTPQIPNGLSSKKVMLPNGGHVFVMANPEPQISQTKNAMNIEQLKAMLQAYHELSSANLSDEQTNRLVELVAETHKQINDLTSSASPVSVAGPSVNLTHGPHAFNQVGYEKYVCDTNPSGFCLAVQAQIETLIFNIMHDTTRKAGMGLRDDGVPADKMCGAYNPNNQIDMSEVIKTAVCMDKDMWPFFRVRPIKGESKHLTKFRQELFCLTNIEPSSGSYEVGNGGSI